MQAPEYSPLGNCAIVSETDESKESSGHEIT